MSEPVTPRPTSEFEVFEASDGHRGIRRRPELARLAALEARNRQLEDALRDAHADLQHIRALLTDPPPPVAPEPS